MNCISIIGGIIGIILISFKSNGKANIDSSESHDDNDENGFTTPMSEQNDEMHMHKSMYIALAIGFLAISAHSWIVIYALYKNDSSFENKIDDALNVAVSNYPPLQNVATIDERVYYTYK